MDPNPKSFPVLSYVMARLPTFGTKTAEEFDIEQPDTSSSNSQRNPVIVDQMPHLSDPKLISAMRRAIHDVYQSRAVLQALGPRPDHEMVDKTKARIIEIEAELARSLEGIVHSIRSTDVDQFESRVQLAEKEKECRENAAEETSACRKILELDDMHEEYEKMLREAEDRLVKIYERAENGEEESETAPQAKEEVNVEVAALLQAASGKPLERVDLSSRGLRFLPEAFGRMAGLRFLNLSNNQLEVIPDSIAGLVSLDELNLASNLLEILPDSIGLLLNLKLLNVSGNKLSALPDSISHCRSLVELDASFNRLAYLPTNIGCELVNLQKLLVALNKIRYLPSSIGEMASLRHLDAHFNELHGLPITIGKLTNLEILNLSSNFTDLKELPETFGELTNLKELDLSNNQIHALPDTFGRLDNLTKLNLEENPIVMPPVEVVKEGVEAVKLFMAKRWLDMLLEEEQRSVDEGDNKEAQAQAGWLTRSTSWLKTVGENVSVLLSPRNSPRDPCLDQQF